MKTYLKISLLFFFVCNLFTACATDGENADPFSSMPFEDCPALSIGNAEAHYLSNHVFGIDSVYMIGNCMHFDVAFSGGCNEHSFNLWWDEEYETVLNDNEKSVKTVLYLVHNNNGDYCEALVRGHYFFDVNPIKHNDFSQVAIEVFSTDASYVYQYRY